MPIKLRAPDVKELKPTITVLGVGGAGGNAVNNMIAAKLEGVDFVVANTDAQALASSKAERRIQLGARITEGLGAGAKPEIGRAAAEETLEELLEHIGQSNMVFIAAGMGGGTGTGAAPVIARAVRELGILTVGVVTKPFHFEGDKRMRFAERGIEELQNYVDTLIIIPNQNLFRVANERTTFAQAFSMADEVLHSGVRGVTDLMVMPGLINLDFNDIKTVMSEMGKAMMGTGEAEGEGRALKAAEAAISNPLLDDVSMKGARGVLINVTGGSDLMLFEVDEAANRIRAEVDPDANIIFGSTINEDMEGRVRVSVVATGIDVDAMTQIPGQFDGKVERFRPRKKLTPEIEAPAPAPAARAETISPVHRQVETIEQKMAQPSEVRRETIAAEMLAVLANAPAPQQEEPLELGGADMPVVEEPAPMPAPRTYARAPAPAPMAAAQEPKKRFGLFGRAKKEEHIEPVVQTRTPVAPAPAAAPRMAHPAMPKATAQVMTPPRAEAPQPQAGAQQPAQADDLFANVAEDDRFEIPAFLRRQAN